MIKDLIKLVLYIISSILKWALQPILFTYGIIRSLSKGLLANYIYDLAVAKDKYGNVVGQYLFNDILIHKEGVKFGSHFTISSVLGENERDNTLTGLGRFIANTLNFIEKDHCKNAIGH